MGPVMLEARGIVRTHHTGPVPLEVLKGLDLSVEEGESVAIVGASGSGKSTLLAILGLLDRPDSGSYRLEGRDVLTLGEAERSAIRGGKIGFVFQGFHLLPGATALDNVALPLVYQGVGRRERARRSADALERVGLGDRTHHRPSQLSGGQQQRVAIARALVAEPRLVLADEPTGALDEANASAVMDLLVQCVAGEGRALVVITHDRVVAARTGHRMLLAHGVLGSLRGPPSIAPRREW